MKQKSLRIRFALLAAAGMLIIGVRGRAAVITGTQDNGGFTWFSVGADPKNLTWGLPMNGTTAGATTTVTSAANLNIQYTLQSAVGNNAALMTAASNSVTLTFATPQTGLTNFTILTAAGNGPASLTTQFNGATVGATLSSLDWFNGSPTAIAANGRATAIGPNGPTAFDNEGGGNPRLYDLTFANPLATNVAVSSITFTQSTASPTRTSIFALSGSGDGTHYSPVALAATSFNNDIVAEPEPALLGIVAVSALGLLVRRRRAALQ